MQFTDLIFLFVFLPSLLVIYYISAVKYRQVVIIAFSLIFYACGSPEFFLLLLFAVMVNVGVAYLLIEVYEKRIFPRTILVLGILFNLTILGYYKYSDFVITNLNRFAGTEFFGGGGRRTYYSH